MPSNTDVKSYIASSKQAYVVGQKPVADRKSTKLLANAFRFGFVAVVLFSGYKFAGQNSAPEIEAFSVPQTSQISSPALPKTGQAVNARHAENWEIIAPSEREVEIDDKSADGSPSPQNDLVLLEREAGLQNADSLKKETYKLPFDVTAKDTHSSLVMKLYKKGSLFQASTVQAEGIETKPYYVEGDSTQPTIGVGYNIKMSATAIGKSGVRRELTLAGISQENINFLMSSERSVSEQARITKHQALALLDVASKRFEQSARSAVGADVFNKLPKHRQAALMMIDYNSNLHKRNDIVSAVRAGNNLAAIEEMETYGMVGGKRQRLNGAALSQTMFYSKDGAHLAVMNPSKVKRDVKSGNALWDDDTAVAIKPSSPRSSSVARAPKEELPAAAPEQTQDQPQESNQAEPRRLSVSGLKGMIAKMRPSRAPDQPSQTAAEAPEAPAQPEASFLNGANVRRVK